MSRLRVTTLWVSFGLVWWRPGFEPHMGESFDQALTGFESTLLLGKPASKPLN